MSEGRSVEEEKGEWEDKGGNIGSFGGDSREKGIENYWRKKLVGKFWFAYEIGWLLGFWAQGPGNRKDSWR
jgi:hypothetical protein